MSDQSHPEAWQRELKRSFTRVEDLLTHLELDPHRLALAADTSRDFPLLVPRGFVARMEKGNPQDPLLLQVLPLQAENERAPGFFRDPLGERAAVRGTGLLRKYRGRWLVLTTGACAVHCRYCFRRHFAYERFSLHRREFDEAIASLRRDPDPGEVILSGGDPLMLEDDWLAEILGRMGELPGVRRIRLHTRLPIVLPERITPRLCRLLAAGTRPKVLVVQANHPREISPAVRGGLAALRQPGITLLNQSVLLRSVNDSSATLAALSEALIEADVLPYYLHQLDPVEGAAHFAVPDERARTLMGELRACLPGYLVPRLVREVAGADCKVPLA